MKAASSPLIPVLFLGSKVLKKKHNFIFKNCILMFAVNSCVLILFYAFDLLGILLPSQYYSYKLTANDALICLGIVYSSNMYTILTMLLQMFDQYFLGILLFLTKAETLGSSITIIKTSLQPNDFIY